MGDEEFSRKADLRFGTDEEYEKELQARQDLSTKDLQYLEGSTGELDGWLANADADPQGWSAWKTKTLATMAALQKRNEEGFSVWAVPPERLGRMVVGGLCHYFERTVAAVDKRDALPAIRLRMRKLIDAIDEAYDQMGIDAPLEITRARPVFEAYERSVAPLRAGIERIDVRRRVRAEGIAAMFELLKLIRAREADVRVSQCGRRAVQPGISVDRRGRPGRGSGRRGGGARGGRSGNSAAGRAFREPAGHEKWCTCKFPPLLPAY